LYFILFIAVYHHKIFLNDYDTRKMKMCGVLDNPGSSVSIVTGYGLDGRAIEIRSPEEAG
jgi:hypothetical protein